MRRISATAWESMPTISPLCSTTLGVDEVVLCGLSMGGYVIFEFLRRWRHRVRALILMDTRAEADWD